MMNSMKHGLHFLFKPISSPSMEYIHQFVSSFSNESNVLGKVFDGNVFDVARKRQFAQMVVEKCQPNSLICWKALLILTREPDGNENIIYERSFFLQCLSILVLDIHGEEAISILKSLNNIMLLHEDARNWPDEIQHVGPFVDYLKSRVISFDDGNLFLFTRFLYLWSSRSIVDSPLDDLLKFLVDFFVDFTEAKGKALDASIDCLKAIFSITLRSSTTFSPGERMLLALFTCLPTKQDLSLDLTLMCHAISILLHYSRGDLLCFVKELPCSPGHELLQRYPRIPWKRLGMLLNCLELQMLRNDDSSMSDVIPMSVLLLRTLASMDDSIRKCLRKQILPSKFNRKQPMLQSQNIKSYLSQFLSSVNVNLCLSCGEFLFTLVRENSRRLIFHFGYGAVAGILMERGIDPDKPDSDLKANEIHEICSSDEETLFSSQQQNWDPVTGMEAKPRQNPFDGMTEEEIDREGEKLYVLLERLKKNGMIQMK